MVREKPPLQDASESGVRRTARAQAAAPGSHRTSSAAPRAPAREDGRRRPDVRSLLEARLLFSAAKARPNATRPANTAPATDAGAIAARCCCCLKTEVRDHERQDHELGKARARARGCALRDQGPCGPRAIAIAIDLTSVHTCSRELGAHHVPLRSWTVRCPRRVARDCRASRKRPCASHHASEQLGASRRGWLGSSRMRSSGS